MKRLARDDKVIQVISNYFIENYSYFSFGFDSKF